MLVHPLPRAIFLSQQSRHPINHLKRLSISRLSPEPLNHGRVSKCRGRGNDLEVLEVDMRVGEIGECLLKMLFEISTSREAEEVEGDDFVKFIELFASFGIIQEVSVQASRPTFVEIKYLFLFLQKVGLVKL